jgi:tetratricopeptide (TPR) repeat protein
LGKKEEALQAVMQGIEKMKIFSDTKGLAHAYKALSDIYSDMGNYENAFAALKKANEIEEVAKSNKIFY